MRRLLPILFLLVAGAMASGARGAQPDVPRLSGRVVDLAAILSPTTEQTLDVRLRALEDSTTEQIAVLTVPSLNGENLEQWATEVFRTWGLGQADQDNGILLLIARDERKIRIEVGYGLEALLTDAQAGSIIRDEMTPRFRDGDFDGGTLAAVDAIIGSLDGTYVPPEASEGGVSGMEDFIVLLLMGLVPGAMGFASLVSTPARRYSMLAFTALFFGMSGGALGSGVFGFDFGVSALVGIGLYAIPFLVLDALMSRSPKWQQKREHRANKIEAFKKARKSGKTSVVVDGVSYSVPTVSSSSGGGFSGGGGSSGGGGASGGW